MAVHHFARLLTANKIMNSENTSKYIDLSFCFLVLVQSSISHSSNVKSMLSVFNSDINL
uniref:Uncharacterized protein n=1 Tax=Rhizophora mucronata TaxID=61149 RepID=A0A2P2NTK6_RHIMU